MSTPRITQRLMVEHSLSSLNLGMGRLAELQEKLSTGRIINRPSDSPTGTNTAMRLREQLAANTQHARNADDALGWLGTADNTLQSMLDSVRKARELVLQGASTGSGNAASRTALATEMTQIREGLLARANTAYLGRPIFAGTADTDVAYNTDGTRPTVAGLDGPVKRTVAEGVSIDVNLSGSEAFGPAGSDLFAVIQGAIDHLRTEPPDPAALSADLDKIDQAMERMRTALADVGTRYGRVEDTVSMLKDAEVDLTASLSEVENVDVAKAVVELQMQEVAYQAALGSTARVLQPSLIDFLR